MAKIVFLQNIEREFLGIMHISALLKSQGHYCYVLVGSDKELIRGLEQMSPDIIAFSCMSFQYGWVNNISKIIKSSGLKATIIVGGAHPTVCPEIIQNPYIDIICRGEGEYPMLDLANYLDKDITGIRGLYVKKDGEIFRNELSMPIKDINKLPFADREIYEEYPFFKKTIVAFFITKRGCIYNCSYCSMPIYRNLYSYNGIEYDTVRYRDKESIISEITFVVNKYNKKMIRFYDSIFIMDKEWLRSFLIEYKKKINLPFTCNVVVNLIDNETVKLLKEANCLAVYFGIETGNELLRKRLLNKIITNEQIEKAVNILRKHNLKFCTNSMYCLPEETLLNAFETLKINKRIKPAIPYFYIYYPLHGSSLMEYALKKGYITQETLSDSMTEKVFLRTSLIKQKDSHKIENLCKLSYIAVKYSLPLFLIKFLIKFPPNIFFDRLYLTTIVPYKIPNTFLRKNLFIIKTLLGLNDDKICKSSFCGGQILRGN